jgi:glycosyltransferase involved in cell wall biosynthesis
MGYLKKANLNYAVAHPLFSINHRLTAEHIEKFILLFKVFELNGTRDEAQNQVIKRITRSLDPEIIDRLANKHDMEPACARAWEKILIGGSDDHSSLNVARMYTEAPKAETIDEFFSDLRFGGVKPRGQGSTPRTMAHNLYGIAYQFFNSRFDLEKYIGMDVLMKFMDKSLRPDHQIPQGKLLHKIMGIVNKHRLRKGSGLKGLKEVIRLESQNLILADPDLLALIDNRLSHNKTAPEDLWFRFVSRVTDKVVKHFGERLYGHLSGANVFSLFETLGAAGSNYLLLAPYFVAFGLFGRDRPLTREVQGRFLGTPYLNHRPKRKLKVAHFTDTFLEINGVAHTLRQQARVAQKTGKDLTIITCGNGQASGISRMKNFDPIAVYDLPEYQEQKLTLPPFLEILDHVHENEYTYIHSATPGPMGLAALAVARVLNLPISATYHTAFPQYTAYLTGDQNVAEIMWRYILWYYDQMDSIYVPSKETGKELIKRGIKASKIRTYPRGVDIESFGPQYRNGWFKDNFGLDQCLKLLYVGRVSREKNLPVLVQAYREICRQRPNVHLVVVGDGPYLDEMQKELQDWPVTFTGYLKGHDLAAAYASSDLFVFPSTTDTFGNVILEAQASGLPVIVTDQGGPKENMAPEKSGLVVPGNDHNALCNAVLLLIDDLKKLKKMSAQARLLMESRSFENAFAKQWKLYSLEKGAAVPVS